ncbi:MAG: AAA family ATPase [Myxococcales bacterium]|nr:AAA family ATPase [Myxococcales bacterium]
MEDGNTHFVGRTRELADLGRLVRRGRRLITITGPGGVGKTLLARRLADIIHHQGEGPEPRTCDLSNAKTRDDLIVALGHAIGASPAFFKQQTQQVAELASTIESKGITLLILDNAEPVASDTGDVVTDLLTRTTNLFVFATSREPLSAKGERVYRLDPPSLRDALQIFKVHLDRNAKLSAADSEMAKTIVNQLDRLPLAVSLAAARVKEMPLAQIAKRVGQSIDILKDAQGNEPRHLSLDRMLEISWDLLTAEERSVLSLCSVFEGGFRLGAAAYVTGKSQERITELLEGLHRKSLLEKRPSKETRFFLLDTVRTFAAKHLKGRARTEGRLRHAEHFAIEGERWRGMVQTTRAARAFFHLTTERANLLAAHGRMRRSHPDLCARIGFVFAELSRVDGPGETLLAVLADSVAAARAAENPSLLAEALYLQGEAYRTRSDFDRAEELFRSSLAMNPPPPLKMRVLLGLAGIENPRADFEQCLDWAQQAHDLATSHDLMKGPWGPVVLMYIGLCTHDRAPFEKAIAMAEESGNRVVEGSIRPLAAHVIGLLGDHTTALGHVQRAKAIAEELSLNMLRAIAVAEEARLLHALGRLEEAHFTAELAVQLCRQKQYALARSYRTLGNILIDKGKIREAEEALTQANRIAEDIGAHTARGETLTSLAAACALQGDGAEARRLLREATDLLQGQDADFLESLEVFSEFPKIAEARRWDREGATAQARKIREEIEKARDYDGPATIDVSIARRMVHQALWRSPSDEKPWDGIELDEAGTWFRVPGSPFVDLSTRRPLTRLLVRMLQQRVDAPGQPVAPTELVSTAWPDQKLLPRAAKNRLHNALTTLRRMGLEDTLRYEDGGYFLDPTVPARIVA